MRLIDIDDIRVMKFLSEEDDPSESDGEREYRNGWNDALTAINDIQPSAEPRMKGRWIKQIDESINAWWYECSVCGDYPLKNAFGYDSLSQFCPWCGAELSEGEESHEDIPEGTL